jgi:hypothetical protein
LVFGANTAPAKGKVARLTESCQELAAEKWSFNVNANTGPALGHLRTLQNVLGGLHDKTITVNVTANTSSATAAEHRLLGHARGGVDSPVMAMANGGVAGVYPASNPPLVRFAEPSTGGEGYVPKNGDRSRNLAIMSEMASWPSVNAQIIPMARGGVLGSPVRSLVNFGAPASSSTRGTRLDTMEAYIGARDAVVSLNQALKDNGRTLGRTGPN